MGRTITLPEDDGPGLPGLSTRLDRSQSQPLAAEPPSLAYPDTLELIHRPGGSTTRQPDLDQPDSSRPATAEELRDSQEELEELLQQFRAERKHRRSVRAARLLVGLVAAGLLAVWLLDPPADDGSENRSSIAFPALSPDGLISGDDYRQTDSALRDRLALRQYVVRSIAQIAQEEIGTSLSPEVVTGPSGVPFISEDFLFPCEHPFQPAAVDAGLRELRALGQTTGKTITVAIAPDKSSILRAELGIRGTALMSCSDRVRESTEQTWGTQPTGPVLTTWQQLAAEQQQHPGEVFQRGDSHWTSQGALVWAQALIDQLIRQGEAPAELRGAPVTERGVRVATRSVPEPADNDLYRLMGATSTETVPVWQVRRPGVTVRARSFPSASGRGTSEFRALSDTEPLIQGRTLVIEDSFFARATGHLAPYFSDLTVMHWADFRTAVQDGTVPSFDRIVIETVQRGWPERSSWLIDGHSVHEALAAELSAPSETAMDLAPAAASS